MTKLFLKAVAGWIFICVTYIFLFFNNTRHSFNDITLIFAGVALWMLSLGVATQVIVIFFGKLRNWRKRPFIFGIFEFSLILVLTLILIWRVDNLVFFLFSDPFGNPPFDGPMLLHPMVLIIGIMFASSWIGSPDAFLAFLFESMIIFGVFLYLYIAFIEHYQKLKAPLSERDGSNLSHSDNANEP